MSDVPTVGATPVAICLGSNLGDRAGYIRAAASRLAAGPLAAGSTHLSPMLDNPPWDCPPDAPTYINAAITGWTLLPPHALLASCMDIEVQLGRDRRAGYHANRTIDIDIALYGDQIVAEPDLTIPHPGVTTRDFFLIPLLAVAATWPVPSLTPAPLRSIAAWHATIVGHLPGDNATRP